MKTRRTIGWVATFGGMFLSTCQAQGLFDELNFRNTEGSGFGLYGVSVYSGYSTVHSLNALPSVVQGNARINYGASASGGWQHHSELKNFAAMYSGNYGGLINGSNYHSFNQSLSLSASRKFARKWTVNLSGYGQDTNLSQYLFEPLSLSVLSQLPGNVNDLAATLGLGQFSSTQAANMLQQGAPFLQSPLRTGLLGDRVLSYSGQLSLDYAYSTRWNFHISGFTAGGQNRFGGQTGTTNNYSMPRTFGGSGGVAFSYAVSPRTQVGLSVDENSTWNHYQNSHGTSATASFGRKMGEHWFLQMNGGGTWTKYTKQAYGNAGSLQAVGGGSLGFKVYAQTFVGSYQMTSSDTFGFAVGRNSYANLAWTWHRPGNRMTVFSGFGRHAIDNTGYINMSGWQVSSGLSANMGGHTSVTAQYVYVDSTSNFLGTPYSFETHSVRLSLNWSPQAVRR